MSEILCGLGQATLFIRHATTLKDKRKVVQSVVQKLRNQGFSVVEAAADSPKQTTIGFSFSGHGAGQVGAMLENAKRLFVGDFEVLSFDTESISLGDIDDENFAAQIDDEFSK